MHHFHAMFFFFTIQVMLSIAVNSASIIWNVTPGVTPDYLDCDS